MSALTDALAAFEKKVDDLLAANADLASKMTVLIAEVEKLKQAPVPVPAPPAPTPPAPTPPSPPPTPGPRTDAQIREIITQEMARSTTYVLTASQMTAWINHFKQPQFMSMDEVLFRKAVYDQVEIDRKKYGWPQAPDHIRISGNANLPAEGAQVQGSADVHFDAGHLDVRDK